MRYPVPMVLLGLCYCARVEATPTFYMVVYSAQDPAGVPDTSHLFATFAQVDENRAVLQHINWFSIRGHKTGQANLVEPDGKSSHFEIGENRTTREAITLVYTHGLRITRWGPYMIDQRLYLRATQQIDLLEGRVPGHHILYKALDFGYREGTLVTALNCIHAVSDIDREHPLWTWTSYGDDAARKVILHLSRWIISAPAPDNWDLIWGATWAGTPVPRNLQVNHGELPH
jgi:hypothetical protein